MQAGQRLCCAGQPLLRRRVLTRQVTLPSFGALLLQRQLAQPEPQALRLAATLFRRCTEPAQFALGMPLPLQHRCGRLFRLGGHLGGRGGLALKAGNHLGELS